MALRPHLTMGLPLSGGGIFLTLPFEPPNWTDKLGMSWQETRVKMFSWGHSLKTTLKLAFRRLYTNGVPN